MQLSDGVLGIALFAIPAGLLLVLLALCVTALAGVLAPREAVQAVGIS